jgi:cold shock protein
MSNREEGTVKFFNPQRGFGFVQADSGGAVLFIAAHALMRAGIKTIAEGDRISFLREPARKMAGKFEAQEIKIETP